MSNKKKGDKAEREAVEFYKLLFPKGYLIEPAQRTMRRAWTKKGVIYVSKANDYFGLWDGMIVNQLGQIIWYQVKSGTGSNFKWLKAMKEWITLYLGKNMYCHMLLRCPGKKWVLDVVSYECRESKRFYFNKDAKPIDKFTFRQTKKNTTKK